MSELKNFHVIQNASGLPQVPASTVSIFVKDQQEAERYAYNNPDRNIYWVKERSIGVWFTPLRRFDDLPARVLR